MAKRITFFVMALHLLLLGFALFTPKKSPQKAKPLIVKTLSCKSIEKKQPPPKIAKAAPKPEKVAPAKQEPIAAAPAPVKPKSVKKTAAATTKKSTTQISAVKKAPAKQKPSKEIVSKELMKELEKNIQQMDSIPKKTESSPLAIEIAESSYQELLINYLRMSLHLPDLGEVKLKLTVRCEGSIAKLVVLKSESEQNRRYLEKELPKLQLPMLEGPLANKAQHTFSLTFCNEI